MKKTLLFTVTLLLLLFGFLEAQDFNITDIKEKQEFIEASEDIKKFDFVGGGDLNSVSNNGQESTAGNISLGLHMFRKFPKSKLIKDIEVDFGINVSSTVDSFVTSSQDVRSFGNYILNPINSRQSARLDFYSLFNPKMKKDKDGSQTDQETLLSLLFDGIFFRFYGSNSLWQIDNQSTHVTALHWKLGLFHELLPDAVARNSYSSVMVGIAGGQRAITGDIRAADSAMLESITGTTKGAYWGADLMFSVKFNNIRAEFIIPFINKGANSIRGLTDTQFISQVRFIGGFPLKLRNDTPAPTP